MTTLFVGIGKQFKTLSSAINAVAAGDVIAVDAGSYTNDFATISKNITIEGIGGIVNLIATEQPPNGKAILTTAANVTLVNVALSGAAVRDGNGAGIRHEAGNLTLVADYLHDNQDGLLAGNNPAGRIDIFSSEFASNGAGDGYTHNLYANELGALNIVDSYFHDAVGGNEIKSRALTTTITGTRIVDGAAQTTGAYDVDLPNGGQALLTGNTIEKGPNEPNTTMIHFGGEAAPYAGSTLTVTGNTLVNDDTGMQAAGRAVNNDQNAGAGAVATVTGNKIANISAANVLTGPGTAGPNTMMTGPVALDTTTPALAVVNVTVGAAMAAPLGQAVNPFAGTALGVLDNRAVTLTLGGAQHGGLAYSGGDPAIGVTGAGGVLTVTGDMARIAGDLAAGLFTYTANAVGSDHVTVALADPGLFLTMQAGDAAAAGPSFTQMVAGSSSPACFVPGTLIATPCGDCAVEALAIGNLVLTVDGGAEAVRWIGRRSYAGRFLAGRRHLWPVRIRAGALAEGVPARDLVVSPRHAMLIDGVLIPAEALIDEVSVVREAGLERVDYVHIELGRHAAVWAEGAASESFCDEDSRGMFANAAEYAALYPDAVAMRAMLPRVETGAAVERVRRAMAGRARAAA